MSKAMNVRIVMLGALIRSRRGNAGIRETAKQIGISIATLSRIENGRTPDLHTFAKLCKWAKVDPSFYLAYECGERDDMSYDDQTGDELMAQDEAQYMQERDEVESAYQRISELEAETASVLLENARLGARLIELEAALAAEKAARGEAEAEASELRDQRAILQSIIKPEGALFDDLPMFAREIQAERKSALQRAEALERELAEERQRREAIGECANGAAMGQFDIGYRPDYYSPELEMVLKLRDNLHTFADAMAALAAESSDRPSGVTVDDEELLAQFHYAHSKWIIAERIRAAMKDAGIEVQPKQGEQE